MARRDSRRHFLKERDAKKLLIDFSVRLKVGAEEVFGQNPTIEITESQYAKVFIVNGKPLLAEIGGELFPTLLFDGMFAFLPNVVVDMGAVPYVCNGADVMAPGVVRVTGEFCENDLVLIKDERYDKPLAIGTALFDSAVTNGLTQGKVVKTIHYVGDNLWKTLKRV